MVIELEVCYIVKRSFFDLKHKATKKNIKKFETLIISDYSKGFFSNYLLKNVLKIFHRNKKKGPD